MPDTNSVEREIRPVVVTRKAALFAGSEGGGETWAIATTVIRTAIINGINPQAWLAGRAGADGPWPRARDGARQPTTLELAPGRPSTGLQARRQMSVRRRYPWGHDGHDDGYDGLLLRGRAAISL